ncbi:hypothetical protein PP175_21220 [Aneurinibacillus sp. Ricciae_BoGa-3]|uniref:hypothetical protein n=1 Tax=Aneurinibacillus sp. Ricciae_BoGa-3 TaxID=3022697 RepID=UPI00233F8263|nr:hypothetical protein [Aneurinibacillus sp. Ricciae_BoGa-3]WCK53813.1 hypothetical protein PP175_21220 [Aneurinibacillus sp. Ricciae_BoGa-3]
MGIFYDLFQESRKTKSLLVKLSRADYYRYTLICESMNKSLNNEYDITPEMLATRILETFIEDAYEDSTNKMAKRLLSDL